MGTPFESNILYIINVNPTIHFVKYLLHLNPKIRQASTEARPSPEGCPTTKSPRWIGGRVGMEQGGYLSSSAKSAVSPDVSLNLDAASAVLALAISASINRDSPLSLWLRATASWP